MTPILVRSYAGSSFVAGQAFQQDAANMAVGGYYPINQTYVPGGESHSTGLFILGILGLLLLIVPGLLILLVWAVHTSQEPGMLTVTYQQTGNFAPAPAQ